MVMLWCIECLNPCGYVVILNGDAELFMVFKSNVLLRDMSNGYAVVLCFICLLSFFTSPSTLFLPGWDGSSWVEPVLSRG